ncbi:MAG: DUF1571 domain-containing protein [Fuerstiella sp.]
MLKVSPRNSPGRRNFVAACVTVLSVGILHCSFDSLPAGEDVSISHSSSSLTAFATDTIVPMPPEAADLVARNFKDMENEPPDSRALAEPQRMTEGGMLDSMETMKFCTLMLQDGARFMENVSDYTVVFQKEERINGDLQEPQIIDMKVQHSPHFAVYMKWKNGERGRQVLYSDEYEDGCMTVKFGGIKRILPALRIDPNCANARAESRYPVTQAGVVGMIKQILVHREADLKRGHGVSCVRLPDQEFDQRKCYVFLVTYESPEFCEIYRKTVMMMDAEYHIPVMVRNFTWATDADGLTEEELDKATLIENYSFSDLNLSSKLVAIDFSRENPRYRM